VVSLRKWSVGSGQGLFYLPQKRVYVTQSGKKLVADEAGVDILVIMGQKIAKPGNFRKIMSKRGIKNAVLTENIERLMIGLRWSQGPLWFAAFGCCFKNQAYKAPPTRLRKGLSLNRMAL
jgi:hypothetical protein